MKFYITAEDRHISIDQAFTLNNIQYPAGYLRGITPTEREAMGLQEVVTVGTQADDRYYFNNEELVGAERRITNTPRGIEQVRPAKEAEIRADGAAKLAAIANPYSDYERESWAIQSEEAAAYLANSEAVTPLIDALAEGRGITKADLAAKIIENNNLFRAACGVVLGEQQRRLDLLSVATTLEGAIAL